MAIATRIGGAGSTAFVEQQLSLPLGRRRHCARFARWHGFPARRGDGDDVVGGPGRRGIGVRQQIANVARDRLVRAAGGVAAFDGIRGCVGRAPP